METGDSTQKLICYDLQVWIRKYISSVRECFYWTFMESCCGATSNGCSGAWTGVIAEADIFLGIGMMRDEGRPFHSDLERWWCCDFIKSHPSVLKLPIWRTGFLKTWKDGHPWASGRSIHMNSIDVSFCRAPAKAAGRHRRARPPANNSRSVVILKTQLSRTLVCKHSPGRRLLQKWMENDRLIHAGQLGNYMFHLHNLELVLKNFKCFH